MKRSILPDVPTSILVVIGGIVIFAYLTLLTHQYFFGTLFSLISGININQIGPQSTKNVHYLNPDMVRLDGFPWDIVEAKKGIYDYHAPDEVMRWARNNTLDVLGVIQYAPGWANGQQFTTPRNMGISNCGIPDLENPSAKFNALRTYPPKNSRDFATYAGAIAKRYQDVTYWQIWNEPNNPIFWPTGPDANAYTTMLSAAYGAIKRANPRAQVVLGGISLNDLDYINALYTAGAGNYFDILAVHLYNPAQPPSAYLANELEKLHAAMVTHDDGDTPIWLTEIGWYTGTAPDAVSEQSQGQYLAQVLAIARSTSYVGAVFWNTLMDCSTNYISNNPEHNFGLFRRNTQPKRAAQVMHGIMLQSNQR